MIFRAASTAPRRSSRTWVSRSCRVRRWPQRIPCRFERRSKEDAIAAAAQRAPRQAQLALDTVKQVLRDARARGQRINPALLDVRAPRYEEREPVFLTAREVDDLASWSSEPRLIQFAAFTGLRLGELLALRDGEVDLHEGCVLVVRAARKGVEGRTKTRKKRRVYLCAAATQALREQLLARRPTPTGLVFPSPRSDGVWNSDNFRADVFAKAVKRAAQKADPGRREDVARLEFHDLRHTFASLMIAAGANPLQIAEALGHSDKTGAPTRHSSGSDTAIYIRARRARPSQHSTAT
jgi:integrase